MVAAPGAPTLQGVAAAPGAAALQLHWAPGAPTLLLVAAPGAGPSHHRCILPAGVAICGHGACSHIAACTRLQGRRPPIHLHLQPKPQLPPPLLLLSLAMWLVVVAARLLLPPLLLLLLLLCLLVLPPWHRPPCQEGLPAAQHAALVAAGREAAGVQADGDQLAAGVVVEGAVEPAPAAAPAPVQELLQA